MIEFKRLTYKNFLSVGNKPIEIDLSGNGIRLLTGANGNGKSTVILALYYALYGKSFRKINLPNMINNINKKNLLVTLEFSIGEQEYRICRGMKPNVFEVWVNGVLREQNATAKEYQDWLVYRVLKMDERTFRQLVVIGSTLFVPFMRLNAADRRVVIDDLLGLDIFSGMLDIAKQRLFELEDEEGKISSEIADLEREIKTEEGIGKSLDDFIRKSIEKIENENREILEEKIPSLRQRASLLDEEIKAVDANKLEEARKKWKERIRKNEKTQAHTEKDISLTEKMISFFRENLSCPSCGQTISEELSSERIEELSKKRNAFQEELDSLLEDYKKRKKEEAFLEEKIEELKRKHEEYVSVRDNLRHFKRFIEANQKKIEDFKRQESVISTKNEEKIQNLSKELSVLTEKVETLKRKRKNYEMILLLLKDDGIKSIIIKNYLPLINSVIRKYIAMTEFNVAFSFDENFEETIKARNRDLMEYNNLSEGEQQRINFALLFAFRELTRMKSSIATNLLIIDEVGDSLLDYDGIMAVNNIFKNIDARIMIITHYPEHYKEIANERLDFRKDGYFTSLHTEPIS